MPWLLLVILAWGCAWLLFWLLQRLGGSAPLALGLALASGVAFSALTRDGWRRAVIALGFPLALSLSGTAVVPAWAWLLPLALLLLLYPLRAWRDAPLFPTPAHALDELARVAPLPPGALVLDAGCGLGDGLLALREAYPQTQLKGVEGSWPLRWLCALRCPWARIRQGDLWRADWHAYALVYLFQRPESMSRAARKACAELQAGAWLVSLEFEATLLQPTHTLRTPDGRALWLYQAPCILRHPQRQPS